MKTYLCLELKKQKKVSPLGRSCFFGDPDFYKMDNSYQDDDFFVCQINLSDIREKINSVYLPPKGLLYFFISLKDMKGKVIYRDFDNADNLERIAFNEGFSFHQKEYKINFTSHHHHKDFMMLYENEYGDKPGLKELEKENYLTSDQVKKAISKGFFKDNVYQPK